ncbi:cytochrome P450 [Myriangium duriaei CBS 260.36]|uniref:Cytochrome P450 n=1 Tax=Myriangium duriaei CBS 260.36 TaxID=1168546 RepID=A0A9P4IT94_9PEZI|nr:cytochrome P450 [Myriangium duriaei CBS 260.36]
MDALQPYHFYLFIAIGAVLYKVCRLSQYESTAPRDKGVAWMGRGKEWGFSYLLAKIRSASNTKQSMMDVYYKFSKIGQSIVLPFPFGRPQVILPTSSTRWIITQPDNVLSPAPIHNEIGQPVYAFGSERLRGDHTIYTILRRDLNKNLANITSDISEEISDAIDEHFGYSTEWTPIQLDKAIREVVTRAVSRMMVGKLLCRYKDYNLNSRRVTWTIMPCAFSTGAFPEWIKPYTSKLTMFVVHRYIRRCSAYLAPMFRNRINEYETLQKEAMSTDKLPNDFITWAVKDALDRNEDQNGLIKLLIGRFFLVNFAAVETSTRSIVSTFYDLLTFPPSADFAKGVQEEAISVLRKSGPVVKDDVNGLVRIDSAIKESLRFQNIFVALQRQVTAPKGTTTDTGLYLPYGSRICISAIGVHNDSDFWVDAGRYDPLRHIRSVDRHPEETNGHAQNSTSPAVHAQSLTSASECYMPFGLGRHSCPGRMFAADQMKLIIGHVFEKYEIKYVGEPRKDISITPDLDKDIVIRRRPETMPGKGYDDSW